MPASPLPHSKLCDTFRASECTAPGTQLGRVVFADDFERCAGPKALVLQHRSEHRPAGVQHGFCHPRLRQSGRIHVTDDNAGMLAHDPRRVLMQEVFPAIPCFRVQHRRQTLLAALLRQRKPLFVSPVERRHLDLATIGERREVFQTEINGDCGTLLGRRFGNLNLNVKIPASTGILGKAGGLDLGVGRNGTREPQSVFAAEHHDRSARLIDLKGTWSIERHPSERSALAGTPRRTTLRGLSRVRKLSGDSAKTIAVDAKFCTGTGHQPDEIKFARPSCMPPMRLALCRTAKVPYIVHRASHAPQMFSAGLVLDTIAVCEDHAPELNWSMGKMQDIRTGRHVVYALHVHLVFVTKYRRQVLSGLALQDLIAIFTKVCRDFGAELKECNGEDDHVHLLVIYPPKMAISALVNSLKGVSSRRLREMRPEVSGRYIKGVLWSPSYFAASCGGAPLSVIAEYVRNQRKGALPPRPEGHGFRAQNR